MVYVVKITRTLDRDQYVAESQKMKSLGGYYSKFAHGFIFKEDPTQKLTA